jgi:AcrR family transcriptional regulator
MSAVAGKAGATAGTAYAHYASKDELVLAACRETKAQFAAAAQPAAQFRRIWLAQRRAPGGDRRRRPAGSADGDSRYRRPAAAAGVIYELGLSPAVRLAAGGTELTDSEAGPERPVQPAGPARVCG